MLRVSLVGNLGADPDVRWSAKGTAVATLRVAVNQVRTGPDGERQENTHWFRVRAFGARAEYVRTFGKGTRVLAVGRLEINQYQSREGETRTGFDVLADEVVAMSPRQGGPPSEAAFDAEPERDAAPVGVSSVSTDRSVARGRNGAVTEGEDLPF